MNKLCFMCLKEDWPMEEVKDIWRVHNMKDICESCGHEANQFINYYGKKKEKDKAGLRNYLNTGLLVQEKFSRLMNAGY